MKPVRIHQPGPPATEEPPERLVAIADTITHPLVGQCGITTTKDGRWALYVSVPADASVPIESVEHAAGGFPVVYEAALPEPVRAGPAYPGHKAPG
jgi:hypothetical protein